MTPKEKTNRTGKVIREKKKQMQIRRSHRNWRMWVMNEDRTAIFPLRFTSAHVLKYQGQIMGYFKFLTNMQY